MNLIAGAGQQRKAGLAHSGSSENRHSDLIRAENLFLIIKNTTTFDAETIHTFYADLVYLFRSKYLGNA
ncbi:hypothetical protein [Dyadobacter sediminis]|uniref:hypothetical protein n=1 Tax=Dyadobacter sediminis TaxID=1493691 RepID=UPI001663EA91|nr:hypothetical protein [Dyadobacter sediminis]